MYLVSYVVSVYAEDDQEFFAMPFMLKNAAIHLTIVSAHGLRNNANASDVQSVVTLDDLFKD